MKKSVIFAINIITFFVLSIYSFDFTFFHQTSAKKKYGKRARRSHYQDIDIDNELYEALDLHEKRRFLGIMPVGQDTKCKYMRTVSGIEVGKSE